MEITITRFALRLGFVSLLSSFTMSQNYVLSVWGFPIGEVQIQTPSPDSMKVYAKSTGLVDLLFPFNNEYITRFDTVSYQCLSYNKSIKQGSFTQKLRGKWNETAKQFEYKKLGFVLRDEAHHSIFSFLARTKTEPSEQLDTKWFFLEHEGTSYRVRLLLAGSANIPVSGDSVSCDHYRLDMIRSENPSVKILDQTDYFSRNITHQNGVRQVWVDQQKSQEIIQASLILSGIPIQLRKTK